MINWKTLGLGIKHALAFFCNYIQFKNIQGVTLKLKNFMTLPAKSKMKICLK